MSKLTYEDKKEIIRLYDEEHMGYESISKKIMISTKVVERIIRKFHMHGEEVLKKKAKRKFSADFKLEVIKRVLSGESKSSVSIEYNIEPAQIRLWIKNYEEKGYNGLNNKPKGRPSIMKKEKKHIDPNDKDAIIKQKDERILELEAEVEALKKLRALVLQRNEQQTKKKTIVVMELRHRYPLRILFKVLKLSKTTYFYQKKLLVSEDKDLGIKVKIKEIYDKNKGRYGYRRIALTLRNENIIVNHKKVKRLMKEMGLYGNTPKAKYKSYKGNMNGAVKNLLLEKVVNEDNHKTYYERHFETTGVNQKWTTDVSEFHIAVGKLYLSPILDMYNDEIVAYDISVKPNFAQTNHMLDIAFKKYKDLEGLIMHSDQGWQYQMYDYHKRLKERGILQSMSRKGNCLDNCVMENFFGKMKNEMLYGHEYEFKTLQQLKEAMEEYIRYYNEERIKVKLKGLTPLQVRVQALQ